MNKKTCYCATKDDNHTHILNRLKEFLVRSPVPKRNQASPVLSCVLEVSLAAGNVIFEAVGHFMTFHVHLIHVCFFTEV